MSTFMGNDLLIENSIQSSFTSLDGFEQRPFELPVTKTFSENRTCDSLFMQGLAPNPFSYEHATDTKSSIDRKIK